MRYVGGKSKIGTAIASQMLIRVPHYTYYVEPFVGAANTLILFKGPRIACDINPYLIAMWQAVQQGWVPPAELSENEYQHIKANQDDDPPLTAFAGFACSFGAKWFGGYARGTGRNYAAEGRRGILRKQPYLTDVSFVCSDYHDLHIPDGSLVYCDPPYAGTQEYRQGGFDSQEFWSWCSSLSASVFVSEYVAPPMWNSIWSKQKASSLDLDTGSKHSVENLFSKEATNDH